MKIARVLHDSSAAPIVALERDGALYAVAELDRIFATRFHPERFASASDFHARVVALGCAGLEELDLALKQGRRPTEARLLPGTFLWLAPCATDRAAYIEVGDGSRAGDGEPEYRFGHGHGLLGHDATVAFPADESEPDFELRIGVLLGEDLRRVSASEADKAILGYTLVNAWTARELERQARELHRSPSRARDFGTQLGPVLVTKDEIDDLATLRAQARVGSDTLRAGVIGEGRFTISEAIAYSSEHVELSAGDVIAVGRLPGGSGSAHGRRVAYDTPVELAVERLGKLTGRPIRGPAPIGWRASKPAT